MRQARHLTPADLGGLKEANELEVSNDPRYPLAVWYNGTLEACRQRQKIVGHLIKSAQWPEFISSSHFTF